MKNGIVHVHVSFSDQFKVLIKDPAYICVLLAGGISFGAVGSLAGVINEVFAIMNYSLLLGSIIAVCGVFLGIAVSVVYSLVFLEKEGQLFVLQTLQLVR